MSTIQSKKLDRFLKGISTIGTNKHLTALRDGFAMTIPITIAGAIAILFNIAIFGDDAVKTSLLGLLAHASGGTKVITSSLTNGSTDWVLSNGWLEAQHYGTALFGNIFKVTIGTLGIYVALFISYSMGVIKRAKSPLMVSAFGLASFFILIAFDVKLFSARGMLLAIIGSFLGSDFFIFFSKWKKLRIKMPPSVPPAVGRGFSALFPGILTLLSIGLINVLVSLPYIWIGGGLLNPLDSSTTYHSFSHILIHFIQIPFISLVKSGAEIPMMMVYMFAVGFLWFFGVHGGNTVTSIFSPIMVLLWIGNLSGEHNVFVAGMMDFVWVGGSGGTFILVVMSVKILPKNSPTREVAKFSLPVSIFNINEPVVFGFPIMFNPKWFIPFIFGPMIAMIWPIIAVKQGLMNPTIIPAPWTSPPWLISLIDTNFDWRSLIVSTLSYVTLGLVYLPFVLWQRKEDEDAIKSSEKNSSEKIKNLKGA